MIRVRHDRHEVQTVGKADAVELVHEGRLSMVIVQRANGSIHVLTPGDPLFNAYCRTNRLAPAKVSIHEPFDGQPMPLT